MPEQEHPELSNSRALWPIYPILILSKVLVAHSCLTLYRPMDCTLPGSSVHGVNSPGKNTGVGSHFLLQGIFLTQESNPGLLHCRQILYHLSHKSYFYPKNIILKKGVSLA